MTQSQWCFRDRWMWEMFLTIYQITRRPNPEDGNHFVARISISHTRYTVPSLQTTQNLHFIHHYLTWRGSRSFFTDRSSVQMSRKAPVHQIRPRPLPSTSIHSLLTNIIRRYVRWSSVYSNEGRNRSVKYLTKRKLPQSRREKEKQRVAVPATLIYWPKANTTKNNTEILLDGSQDVVPEINAQKT
jgi:hypothetical protein